MRQVGRTTGTVERAVKAAREGNHVKLVVALEQEKLRITRQILTFEGAERISDRRISFGDMDHLIDVVTIHDGFVDMVHGRVMGFDGVVMADHYACEIWLSNTWASRELAKINGEAIEQ